jgi:hypothetical protein
MAYTFSYAFLHFASRTLLCPDFPPFPMVALSHFPMLFPLMPQTYTIEHTKRWYLKLFALYLLVWFQYFPYQAFIYCKLDSPVMGLYEVKHNGRPRGMLTSEGIKTVHNYLLDKWIKSQTYNYKGFPLFSQLRYSMMVRRLLSCFPNRVTDSKGMAHWKELRARFLPAHSLWGNKHIVWRNR